MYVVRKIIVYLLRSIPMNLSVVFLSPHSGFFKNYGESSSLSFCLMFANNLYLRF